MPFVFILIGTSYMRLEQGGEGEMERTPPWYTGHPTLNFHRDNQLHAALRSKCLAERLCFSAPKLSATCKMKPLFFKLLSSSLINTMTKSLHLSLLQSFYLFFFPFTVVSTCFGFFLIFFFMYVNCRWQTRAACPA